MRLAVGTVLFLVVSASAWGEDNSEVIPLRRAHAHNDYEHARPLLDALDHGFCSIEADIFLNKGDLLVGHTVFDLRRHRTLEALYLKPLRERIHANGGRVYPGGPTILLLIDLKTPGNETYPVLASLLEQYQDILCVGRDGKVEEKGVRVVISGSCPRDLIAKESPRVSAIDGRMGDLDSDAPVDLIPLVSDSWSNHFKWRGKGEMPEEERNKLRAIVSRAHAKGRLVRFWATPESRDVWREQLEAGVDLLNTDKLADLREFLLENQNR